jgi:dTDP-4-dehydrorhamnose 3,5-epimerase
MTSPTVLDMTTAETAIDGLLILSMKQVHEDRGVVREFYRDSSYSALLPEASAWRQVNVTESRFGAIRGLHGEAMTKLVSCIAGEAFGAYLDARPESPSYGKVVTVALTAGVQVLVPAGVCNGFQSVSEPGTQYLYCFTDEWKPGMAGTAFTPLDPGLDIAWPVAVDRDNPRQISAKDLAAPAFSTQVN